MMPIVQGAPETTNETNCNLQEPRTRTNLLCFAALLLLSLIMFLGFLHAIACTRLLYQWSVTLITVL